MGRAQVLRSFSLVPLLLAGCGGKTATEGSHGERVALTGGSVGSPTGGSGTGSASGASASGGSASAWSIGGNSSGSAWSIGGNGSGGVFATSVGGSVLGADGAFPAGGSSHPGGRPNVGSGGGDDGEPFPAGGSDGGPCSTGEIRDAYTLGCSPRGHCPLTDLASPASAGGGATCTPAERFGRIGSENRVSDLAADGTYVFAVGSQNADQGRSSRDSLLYVFSQDGSAVTYGQLLAADGVGVYDEAFGAFAVGDGTALAVGALAGGSDTFSTPAYLAAISAGGTLISLMRFATLSQNSAHDVAVAPDGSILVVGGAANASEATDSRGMVWKFDTEWNVRWSTSLGNGSDGPLTDIAIDSQGLIYVAGPRYTHRVTVLNTNGAIVTQGAAYPNVVGLTLDSTDRLFLANAEGLVWQAEPSGNVQWEARSLPGVSSSVGLAMTPYGLFYQAGTYHSVTSSALETYFAYTSPFSTSGGSGLPSIYQTTLGPDFVSAITSDPNGRVYIAGTTTNTEGLANGFVMEAANFDP